MVEVALVMVGDELLSGKTLDRNAWNLARALRELGAPVIAKETVRDEEGVIANAIARARAQARVVLVSGGLGPTADDLTRAALARHLGVPLREDAEARAWLEELFARLGRPLSAANLVQAQMPEGTVGVRNPLGTACGILAEDPDGFILLLPGVPRELRAFLEERIPELLDRIAPERPRPSTGRVTLLGMGESEVGEVVRDLMERGRDPAVGCYPRTSGQVLALESFAPDGAARIAADIEAICQRLGHHVVAPREVEVEEVLLELLKARGATLAVAESLTAGRVADRIARVPGASEVFLAGFATYANAAKVAMLGVPEAVLAAHGAVSEEVAAAMADGARAKSGATYAVSTTGIAGPGGAVPGKPVGTVAFGVSGPEGTTTLVRHINGDREMIRERSAVTALDLLRRRLLEA